MECWLGDVEIVLKSFILHRTTVLSGRSESNQYPYLTPSNKER